ncbi:hypothetical protein NPIL_119451 [Nephila pilipes]|uniref:Uncharacterized protein n=1 Tax=Nephila pilipes TaxID=299642 RepID=A0A8X6TKG0_NEPPI|nr:hypothetical protein NPIL_119451 [Nephila pilipes]
MTNYVKIVIRIVTGSRNVTCSQRSWENHARGVPTSQAPHHPITCDARCRWSESERGASKKKESDPRAPVVVDGSGSFFNFTRDLVNYDKGLNRDDKLASTLFYKAIQRGEFWCNTPI